MGLFSKKSEETQTEVDVTKPLMTGSVLGDEKRLQEQAEQAKRMEEAMAEQAKRFEAIRRGRK